MKSLLCGMAGFALTMSVGAGVVVKWGDANGDTGIVSAQQAKYNAMDNTFDPGFAISPSQGSSYYSGHAADRSHTFYGACSVLNEEAVVKNSAGGDYIDITVSALAPGSVFESMVVWQDFLTADSTITDFNMAFRRGGDGWIEGDIRGLVQKETGQWYASEAIEIVDSSEYVSYSGVAADLDWFAFSPFLDGVVSIADTPAAIDMTDITSAGFFFSTTNTYTANKFAGGYIRSFEVNAVPEPATMGIISMGSLGILFVRRFFSV